MDSLLIIKGTKPSFDYLDMFDATGESIAKFFTCFGSTRLSGKFH